MVDLFKEWEDGVNKKAASDPEFKKTLLTDTRGFLNKHGFKIPDNVDLKVYEEGGRIHIKLPDVLASGELSDESLEQVAGGCAHVWHTLKCTGTNAYTLSSCT
jgi:hypothetical protein